MGLGLELACPPECRLGVQVMDRPNQGVLELPYVRPWPKTVVTALVGLMPAKSKKQLKYAYAHKDEPWAQEMIAKTPEKTQSRMMKKGKGHGKSKRRS